MNRQARRRPTWGLLGFGLTLLACEPASITEARDQLGRGERGNFSLVLPLANDTFFVSKFLPSEDTITLSNGVLGVRVQSDEVGLGVGDELRFDALTFDQFAFSFDEMLQTSEVSTGVSFPSPASSAPGPFGAPAATGLISFNTPAGSQVSAATVDSGQVVRTMQNQTVCPATIDVALVDAAGDTTVAFPSTLVPANSTSLDSTDVDGVTVTGDVTVDVNVSVGACIPGFGESVLTDVTFRPMALASVDLANVNEGFDETYQALASESRIQAIDTVAVRAGDITLSLQNRLPIALPVDVTLNGVLDAAGNPLTGSTTVPAAPGDGSTTTGTLVFNLAGSTMIPADVDARAIGTAVAATASITPTVATDAALLDGSSNIIVERVAGALDPGSTPELTVSVEQFQTLDPVEVDFENLEDPIRQSSINQATVDLSIGNDADVPIAITGFTLGLVRVAANGDLVRDGAGNPIYETDSTGMLVLDVADVGSGTLAVPRSGNTVISIDAAPLVNRAVNMLLNDTAVAFVAATDTNIRPGAAVTVGDGSVSSISRADSVRVGFDFVVGLDFTIPTTGLTFSINQWIDGADVDEESIDDLAERVVAASATALVGNFTPFGVQVDIAFASDSLADDVDVFAQPDAVVLNVITLGAPPVGADGVPTGTVSDSVVAEVLGDDVTRLAEIVFGDNVTAGLRMTLMPGVGGTGRGAIRTTDMVTVDAGATIEVQRGNR